MANNIQFTIGSAFQGEGFIKAQQAVGLLNKDAKAGAGAINALAGSIGVLDGKAAQAVSAVIGVINSVMTLNPVVIGITAAISALTWAIGECNRHQEEMKKKAEEARKSFEQLATKVNQDIFNKAIADAKALGDEYDRITKHAKEMTEAINALDNQTASGGILQLQADKVTAVFAEVTEEGKQLVAAEYDLKIATAEAALARQQAEQNLAAATQAVVDKEGEIANLMQQKADMEVQLNRLKENNVAFETASKEEREKWLKNISELQAKMADVDAKIIASKEKLDVLQINEQTAIEKMTAVETAATSKVEQYTLKQQELTDAIETRRAEEAEAAEIAKANDEQTRLEIEARENQRFAEKELARAEREAKDAVAEVAKTQKEAADAASALKQAQLDYARKLSEYNQSGMATFEAAHDQVMNNRGLHGGPLPVEVTGKIIGEFVDANVEDAIRNGAISTVKDMSALERQAGREGRNLINKTQNQQLREAQEYKRISEKNPKLLNQFEKDFKERYEKLQQAQQERKAELQKAKDEAEKKGKEIKEIAGELKSIKTMLTNLGLS